MVHFGDAVPSHFLGYSIEKNFYRQAYINLLMLDSNETDGDRKQEAQLLLGWPTILSLF